MRGIMTKNKFLIINADDFGMSREFNLAIRDLMNNQSITTTSIMANGLAFSEAVSFIKGNRLAGGIAIKFVPVKSAPIISEISLPSDVHSLIEMWLFHWSVKIKHSMVGKKENAKQ